MINKMLTKLSLAFSAGAVGGLANGLIVWLFGFLHITTVLGVSIAPDLAAPLLNSKIVWGGIWGILFLLPLFSKNYLIHGVVLSIAPSITQLLLVFPNMGAGYLGFKLGLLTPIFVLIFNAVWGIVGVYFYRLIKLPSQT